MKGLLKASEAPDWGQVVSNGGPPCFHIEEGKFCFRAERWAGHPAAHRYLPIHDLFMQIAPEEMKPDIPWDPSMKMWMGLTDSTPQHALLVAAPTQKKALQYLNQSGNFTSTSRFRNYWNEVTHLDHYRAIATKPGVWKGSTHHHLAGEDKFELLKMVGEC